MKKRSASSLYNALVSSLSQGEPQNTENMIKETIIEKNNWTFYLRPEEDIQTLAIQGLKSSDRRNQLNKIINQNEERKDSDWVIIPTEQNDQYSVIPICLTKREHAVILIVQSSTYTTTARILDPVGRIRGSLANAIYRTDLDLHVQAHLVSMGFEKDVPKKVVYMDHQKMSNDSQCTYWCQHYMEWLEDNVPSEPETEGIDSVVDELKKQASQLPDDSHFAQKVSANTFAEAGSQILKEEELDYAIVETDTLKKKEEKKAAPKAGSQ